MVPCGRADVPEDRVVLPEDEREFLLLELAECRAAIEGDDLLVVQEAVARLEVSAQRIGEAIYAAAEGGS